MPNSFSPTGLTTASRDELIAILTAGYQQIYGSDINLESDTPDGQMMNIYVQMILDLQDLILQIYNSFDPDNAIGNVLDQRVAINGIQRQAATYTTTYIEVVASQSLNLYGLDQSVQPVYTVQDNAGNQWELITTQLGVTAGTHQYLFQSAVPGEVLTVPNTITIPVTIVLGIVSVNNPDTYVTLGINEESDAALKIRRSRSVSIQSQGYFQALVGALENIPGISSAIVIENDTDGPDGDGIPGHSIWAIVSGTPTNTPALAWNAATTYAYGDIASDAGVNYISIQNSNTNHLTSDTNWWSVYNPIAQAIYAYRNAGCGMFNSGGASAEDYTIIQIDGSAFTVYWDGVELEDLFIKFTASSLNGVNPANYTAIKNYLLANFQPGVYEEVNVNALGTYVQLADPNALITSSGFSNTNAGGTYYNALFPSAKNKQFSYNSNTIIILPIILSCPNGVPVLTLVSNLWQVTNVTVSVASGGSTIQFTPLGGYFGYTYAVISGAGSINGSGLYTSATAGTDVVEVTDSLSNTAIATITVV